MRVPEGFPRFEPHADSVAGSVGRSSRLLISGLSVGYDRKEIIQDLTLEIRSGEIVAVVGANGAGKSTLLRAVAGTLRSRHGRLLLDGVEITGLPAHERVRRGISYLMQGGEVFPTLTSFENLKIAAGLGNDANGKRSIEWVLDYLPSLKPILRRRAGLLSGGQRKCLAVGMTLAQRPKLMLLDEPSAGLAPGLTQTILGAVSHAARTSGASVLLVEQRLRDALRLADRAVVLASGLIRAETWEPRQWLDDPDFTSRFFALTDSDQEG